jgi:hypothetical protein
VDEIPSKGFFVETDKSSSYARRVDSSEGFFKWVGSYREMSDEGT